MGFTRWVRRLPTIVWAPVAAGLIVLVAGVLGVAVGYVPVFPGMASSIYLQTAQPESDTARLSHVLGGHSLALFAGLFSVWVTGAAVEPSSASLQALTWARAAAAVIAMVLTIISTLALRVAHPPAAATASLVALGAIAPTAANAAAVLVVVLVLGVLGELFRRLRNAPADA
ncbi:MAG: HPP family protein [Anaerolineae bacterium]